MTRWSPKLFRKFDFLTESANRIPTRILGEERRDLLDVPNDSGDSHVRIRAYERARATTGMIIHVNALTHCHYRRRRTPIEEYSSGCGPAGRRSLLSTAGPFFRGPRPCELSTADLPRRVTRERSGLLLRGSASLKSSIYLSIFITARSLLLLHLFHPLSPFVTPRSLFFLSLSLLPPYLSGFPLRAVSLPFGDRYRARATVIG